MSTLHMVHRDDVESVVKGAVAFYHERGQSLWEIMVGSVVPGKTTTKWWWERVWAHPQLIAQEKAVPR